MCVCVQERVFRSRRQTTAHLRMLLGPPHAALCRGTSLSHTHTHISEREILEHARCRGVSGIGPWRAVSRRSEISVGADVLERLARTCACFRNAPSAQTSACRVQRKLYPRHSRAVRFRRLAPLKPNHWVYRVDVDRGVKHSGCGARGRRSAHGTRCRTCVAGQGDALGKSSPWLGGAGFLSRCALSPTKATIGQKRQQTTPSGRRFTAIPLVCTEFVGSAFVCQRSNAQPRRHAHWGIRPLPLCVACRPQLG